MNAQSTNPGEDKPDDLVKAIREFLADARFIIDKVDEFNLSLKLAKKRSQGQDNSHHLTNAGRN